MDDETRTTAETPAEDPVARCLRRSGQQVFQGDFATARQCLEEDSANRKPEHKERIDAARASLRLDPAAITVVLVCLAGIVTIALLTLFHSAT